MPLQYVGGTSGVGTSTGYTVSLNGTLTGGLASSPAPGDVVVVFSGFGNTASSAPAVSGNASGAYLGATAAQHINDTWDTEFRSFYQKMGATPDTTLTITRATNAAYGGGTTVQVWRGADPTTPFIGAATPASGGNGAALNPPAYNPAVSGALIIAGGAGTMPAAGTAGYTAIGGMSNAVTAYGNGTTAGTSVIMASYAYAGASYDPATATGGTQNNTSSSWAGVTLALRPAPTPAYTLTCNSGSYSTAGQVATLLRTKLLTANSGSYALAGQSATLTWAPLLNHYTLTANHGTYAATGQAANLVKGRVLTASVGSYAITGQAATLKRDRNLVAQPGAYSLAGQTAVLLRSRLLTADGGSYSISGQAATITYAPLAAAYVLTAQSGSYALAGQAASLYRDRNLTAQAGSYNQAGQAASLLRMRSLVASHGTYATTGQAATLVKGRVLTAQRGLYAYTGQGAVVTRVGMAWPLASDVRLGVQYGPTGAEYTGTMNGGGNAILMRRR